MTAPAMATTKNVMKGQFRPGRSANGDGTSFRFFSVLAVCAGGFVLCSFPFYAASLLTVPGKTLIL
jgi:hypothetical protein